MNVVITGASGGIGYSTAIEFAKIGARKLFLISRNREKLSLLKATLAEYDCEVYVMPFDLTGSNIDVLIQEISKSIKGVDILINNAGAITNKRFTEITFEDFDKVINTNFRAPFFIIQGLLPYFNKNAHVINISSMGGFQGSIKFPGLSVYSSSKGALSTLTECLASEYSDSSFSFNCLALGSVQTEMLEMAFPGYKALTSSDSIAEYICWFALHANKWMNGKVVPVSISTP
jgi:NAD(P)-dependent dehydrogenase (short-subunit alcohol dehydrogenase family)